MEMQAEGVVEGRVAVEILKGLVAAAAGADRKRGEKRKRVDGGGRRTMTK